LSDKESKTEFKSGLTWRSMLALLYSVVVFSPAVIWLQLVTIGAGLAGLSYFVLLVFVEYSRIAGKRLTKQEAAIIFGPASLGVGGGYFLDLIYRSYFMQHPIPRLFGIDVRQIPTWWAPPYTINALELRTFIHPVFFTPLIVAIVTFFTSFAGGLFFGILGREIFIEGERLEFPLQQIDATAITTLCERDEQKISIFSWTALIGLIYGIILYTVPTITRALKKPVEILPIPWFDFYDTIERFMPGGALGVATDAIIFASGIMLPPNIVIGMFIGSLIRFLIINPLLVHFGWTDWATRWVAGMTVTKIYQESTLYFWLNPLIGIGFAVGIVPILLRWRMFARIISRNVFKISSTIAQKRISGKMFPRIWLIILFLIGCVGAIIIDLLLVPGFPIWALILYEIVFPFIYLLTAGRMIGITGQEASIPYLKQLTILASGYPKIDAWFLPLSLNPGTGWLRTFKVAQLTETDPRSYIYTQLIAFPLAVLVSFIYVSLFWKIAPIPSAAYPAPAIQWPVSIMNQCVWITRPEKFFHIDWLLASFAIYGGITAVFELIGIPISMVSIAVGLNSPIPVPMTMLIGLIVGMIISRVFGKEWYQANKITLAAGMGLGEGIAIIFGVAGALAITSLWARPY